MDSAVSEASTMLYLPDQSSIPFLGAVAMPQQALHSSGRKPVKRQASALSGSELMSQTADFLAQQQVNWVQLWPANYQLQQAHMAAGWPWGGNLTPQQLPAALAAAGSMQLQLQDSSAAPLLGGMGSGPAAGAGVPLPVREMAGPAVDAAAASPPAPMRAPQHRLPKRRASAPHLPAALNTPPVFKCVPHVGGADCQCTQCLCARTDELCQRIIAQRAAQAAGSAAAQALPPAAPQQPYPQQPYARQPYPQQQQQQQQEDGRVSRGRSPTHVKRKSFELLPTAKSRKSLDGRHSPSSSGSPPLQSPGCYAYQHAGLLPAGYVACGPVLNGTTMADAGAGPAGMSRAASAQLRGQFQQLSVSCSPFEEGPGVYAAVAAGSAQQRQGYAGADCAGLLPGELGSAHSGAEEEAIDRELENMLAQIGWSLEPASQPARSARQQQQQQQQQLGVPMLQQAVPSMQHSMAPAGYAAAPRLQQQQQQPAAPRLPATSSAADAELLRGLDGKRLPSLDGWGLDGPHPRLSSCSLLPEDVCPGSSELHLLDDLLESHPEEASLVDLLLK